MSLEAIIDVLVLLTQGVVGIGHVHNYNRMHSDPEQMREYHGIEDQTSMRGWSIDTSMWFRRGSPGEFLALAGEVVGETHHLVLQNYTEINDVQASQVQWRIKMDALRVQFRSPFILEEVAQRFTYPIIAFEGEAVVSGLYACHDMEMTMDVTELFDTNEIDPTFIYRH